MQSVEVHPPVSLLADEAEPDELLLAEQVRAQYGHMPGAFLGSALLATVMAMALAERLTPYALVGWLAAAYGNSCLRFGLWGWFKSSRPALEDMPRWGHRFTLSAAIAGIVWGLGGIILHAPGSFTLQVLVSLALVGMTLMTMFFAASSLASFVAFTYPVLILSALPYLTAGDTPGVAIGLAIFVLLPLLTCLARVLAREFRGSLEVRLRNARLLAELHAQKGAAEEASLAKSRFVAVASHDLRQPLHALSLFAQALAECPLPGHERQLVANIRRAIETMDEMFDALLDISRLDAGAVRARVATFGLEELFERLRFEFSAVAQQKGLRFRVAGTALLVRSDPELLAQILRNLLANAMRYTDHGGVLLGARRRGGKIRIEVWDTGCGIPEEQRSHVFEEFTQLANPERDRRKGLGLGLAIVARLVRLLAHTIELRSVVGRGSAFGVTLEVGRKEDHVPTVQASRELKGSFDLSGILALVIDDEATVRHGMEALLRKWSCEVIAAASGAEIVEKLSTVRRTPDIIIADYKLREEANGVALIERLRGEFNTDVPALLITAATAAERRDCEVGGLPVLPKPVNPARLRTLLAHIAGTATRTRPRASELLQDAEPLRGRKAI
jgi:signal transduction histidine kinase